MNVHFLEAVDLVLDCPLASVITQLRASSSMGQRTSSHVRPKLSLTWVLRGQQHISPLFHNPENSILRKDRSRSSKCTAKSPNAMKNMKDDDFNFENVEKFLENERVTNRQLDDFFNFSSKNNEPRGNAKRAISEPSLILRDSITPIVHEKHRHRKGKRSHQRRSKFGYEITDLDYFLTKASIEEPANIPVVISSTSVLYQTQGGIQDEIVLPLGTVVNAVFKNQAWLYVQTPHGREGYVVYSACLPLGILPQPTRGPCWENSNDVFPRPLGNITDTKTLGDVRAECGVRPSRDQRSLRTTVSACGEHSVDRLYLRAAANARTVGSRQALVIIQDDYTSHEKDSITVSKGDVVALLSNHMQDWFWVRSKDGREGLIPAIIAGNGYL